MALSIRTNPRIFFTTREQTFRIKGTGLMPLTVHYLYVERKRVNANDIKVVGSKLGNSIISDINGMVEFDYYYNSGISSAATSEEEAKKTANLLAGTKEIVLSNIEATALPSDFRLSSTSYMQTEIYVSVYIPPQAEFQENTL